MPVGPNRLGIYPDNPRVATAQLTTGEPLLDGTGAVVTLVTAATSGTRIDYVIIKAAVATTAGMVRFFVYNGSTTRLVHEEAVTAIASPGATVTTFETIWTPTPTMVLPTGYILKATTANSEAINLAAVVADF